MLVSLHHRHFFYWSVHALTDIPQQINPFNPNPNPNLKYHHLSRQHQHFLPGPRPKPPPHHHTLPLANLYLRLSTKKPPHPPNSPVSTFSASPSVSHPSTTSPPTFAPMAALSTHFYPQTREVSRPGTGSSSSRILRTLGMRWT